MTRGPHRHTQDEGSYLVDTNNTNCFDFNFEYHLENGILLNSTENIKVFIPKMRSLSFGTNVHKVIILQSERSSVMKLVTIFNKYS